MSGSVKVYSLVLFLITAVKSAESALAFNSTPDDPTYVAEGQDIVLVWEYTVGNRQNELDGIVWSVTDAENKDIPLIYEDKAGKRHISSRILSAYKGRVNVTKRATLIIQNATLNDSRSFNCVLSPTAGSGASIQRSSVRVIVTVPPTVIVVPPRGRYANVGDPATITCNATGIPTPNITWYRDGNPVSGSRYQIGSTAESSQLTIKSVSNADHGYYVCQASSNGMEPADASHFLGVIKALLKDSSLPVSYKANHGDTAAALICPVISHPPPEVEWTFKSATVEKSLSTVLVIRDVNEASFGTYSCTARSLEGTSQTFNISLESTDVSIAVSIDVSTGIETNTIRWIEETNATEYLVRIFVKDVKEPVSYLGDGKNTTLEIVHSGLESKTGKSLPDPVTVNVTVLAIRENEFIGTQSLFNIEISGASIPGLNFISVIVLLVVTLSI